MHGEGIYTMADGSRLSGTWSKGSLKKGYGSFVFENGDSYEGEWRKDRMWGFGKYIYKDGTTLEGNWKANKFTGR